MEIKKKLIILHEVKGLQTFICQEGKNQLVGAPANNFSLLNGNKDVRSELFAKRSNIFISKIKP